MQWPRLGGEDPDDTLNLILCGYTCAGKTTASQHLTSRYGYLHVEASDFMHLNYYYRHGFQHNTSIDDFAEQALVQIPHIVAEKICEYLRDKMPAPAVISGFRSIEEVKWLINKLSYTNRRFQVVFIEAEQAVRFNRMKERNRIGDEVTFEKFKMREEQQRRMGLESVRKSHDTTLWKNNGTLELYLDLVDSNIVLDCVDEIDVTVAIGALEKLTNVKLEDAILIALLSVWSSDENRLYYTTSEIAAIINNQVFKNIQPKHRENINRYFYQDFYAHYEIDTRSKTRRRTYRLSNTGYGRALRALRDLRDDLVVINNVLNCTDRVFP